MQNIKVTKKKFNFDVFLKNVDKKNVEVAKDKKIEFKDLKHINESESNEVINENLFKENDIKLKYIGGVDTLRSPDLYRDIIKTKTKLENSHRFEYIQLKED